MKYYSNVDITGTATATVQGITDNHLVRQGGHKVLINTEGVAPTTATEGLPGQFYMMSGTNILTKWYVCTAITVDATTSAKTYTWVLIDLGDDTRYDEKTITITTAVSDYTLTDFRFTPKTIDIFELVTSGDVTTEQRVITDVEIIPTTTEGVTTYSVKLTFGTALSNKNMIARIYGW